MVSDEGICILPLANELPEAWSVRMRFKRLTSKYSVEILFRTANGLASFTLGAWDKGMGGVQIVDGSSLLDGDSFMLWLENERPYEWVVEYRAGLVRIIVDGKLRQERDITGKQLELAHPWDWTPPANAPALLIGSWKSSTRFESVEWRAL